MLLGSGGAGEGPPVAVDMVSRRPRRPAGLAQGLHNKELGSPDAAAVYASTSTMLRFQGSFGRVTLGLGFKV